MHARHGAGSSEPDSSMPDLYSADAVEDIVPAIMQRQIRRLQALLVSPGIDALHAKGGWKYIPRDGAGTASMAPSHVAPPARTAQCDMTPVAQPSIARTPPLALLPPPTPAQQPACTPNVHHTPLPRGVGAVHSGGVRAQRMRHAAARAALPPAAEQRTPQLPAEHAPSASQPSGRTRSRMQ